MVKTILPTATPSATRFLQSDVQPMFLAEKTNTEDMRNFHVVLIPDETSLTPLEEYERELLRAGVSSEHVKEIIDGLADSPLYESTSRS